MSWEECTRTILRYYPSISLKKLKETTKKLSEEIKPKDQQMNLGHPEHKAEELTT
jgi:hypothetical protein